MFYPKVRICFADFPCLHCSISARGFSPRRPDAVVRYVLARDCPALARIFKGQPERTRRRPEGRRFSAAPPTLSPIESIRRSAFIWRPYQEKVALPRVSVHRLQGRLHCRLAGWHSACRRTRRRAKRGA